MLGFVGIDGLLVAYKHIKKKSVGFLQKNPNNKNIVQRV